MSETTETIIVDPAALSQGLEELKASSGKIQGYVDDLEGINTRIGSAFIGDTSTQFQMKMKKLAGNLSAAKQELDKVGVSNLSILKDKYEDLIKKSTAQAESLESNFSNANSISMK